MEILASSQLTTSRINTETKENKLKLNVKCLTPNATIPTYATDGSACFDIYSTDSSEVNNSQVFSTGIAFEIPKGYVMLVFSRSGHGFNKDVRLANCVGVIDSDYRGELKVKLTNDNPDKLLVPLDVKTGDRIAQAMLLQYDKVEFEEVDDLTETARGVGGFGHTW